MAPTVSRIASALALATLLRLDAFPLVLGDYVLFMQPVARSRQCKYDDLKNFRRADRA
jgi:hypothetical protein